MSAQLPLEVEIVDSDFDVAAEYQAICKAAPKSGAVVFFVGLVRDFYDVETDTYDAVKNTYNIENETYDEDEAQKIEYLELSHYAGMTESLCQKIVDQAREKYPFDAVRLIHRVGKISANEQIVMVAVASRHRDNAYQASRFIMDYLKTQATIWKKEVGSRGEQWIGMKQKDTDAADQWS